MIKNNFWLACIICTGIFIATATHGAFESEDFEVATLARDHYDPGTDNVLVGEFQLPDPVADTIVTNGATATVSPRDTLSSFASSNKYHDADADVAYDNGEGVATSSDELLSPTDVVLTDITGILTAFPAMPTETETKTAVGWIDSGPTTGVYDSSENLGTLVRNASSATNGRQVRLFPSDIAYLADSNDANYNVTSDNAIVEDADADGYISSGDTVLLSGPASVHQFDSADNVCFDASISADTEYDVGEIIWKDIAGDCSSFTSGVDIILAGNAAPSGTSTEFGTENEVGFMDGDGDDTYDCTRGGDCEGIVYSGASGTNLTTDGNLTTSAVFFDSSSEGTDGVRTISDSWDEASNALETIVFFTEKTDSGEAKYFYLDADSNADFTSTDPVLEAIIEGNALSTGQTWRTFYDNDHYYYDKEGDGQYFTYSTGHDALVLSEDAILNAGALDGTGTDEVLVAETIGGDGLASWRGFASSEKFHDHNSSGSYADGDDIIQDNDSNGLYNADDFISIKIGDVLDEIEDVDLDGIYIYQRAGSSCAGSGTDTLIGSDTSTPYLDQAIAITKNSYSADDSVASRTICIYADISASASVTTRWWPEIPTSGSIFASGTVTQSVPLREEAAMMYIANNVSATLTASSRLPEATASYIAQFTQGATTAPAGSILYVIFPSGYDVSGASAACTDDGVSVTGTGAVFGQIVGIMNIGGEIAAGSAVSCTFSDVVNPATEAETGTFLIATVNGDQKPYSVDDDSTITISSVVESSTSNGRGTTKVVPASFTLDITSPNGGELFEVNGDVTIEWNYTGNTSIAYANIYASVDGGENYTRIARFTENDGSYVWSVNAASSEMRIKVAVTDLAEDLYSDESDATFIVLDEDGEVPIIPTEINSEVSETRDAICGTRLPSGIDIGDYLLGQNPDGSVYPAIYYIASDCARHSFLNEATYYTYQNNFSIVKTIPIAQLATIMEGRTMPVNPETILVKTTESPDVYYVIGQTGDISPVLVKIRSEAEALEYFGPTWSQSILDIPTPLLNLHTKSDLTIPDVLNRPKTLLNRYTLGR